MSYQEKRTITSIITGAAVLAAYCIYAFGRYQSGAVAAGDLKFWAITMLVFSISWSSQYCDDQEIEKNIKMEMVEDEMDKLIELKSMRVGFVFAGIGFVAALLSLVLDHSPVVMLNIMFISFSGGSLFEGFTQLYYYRKGI
jgi:hypothetical protein